MKPDRSTKVILATFAGRRDRMELLTFYANSAIERGLIDEWHVWDFARNDADRAWLRQNFPVVRLTPSSGEELFDSGLSLLVDEVPRRFEFSVSATNDVHLGLSPKSTTGEAYEIVVGGWSNRQSVIRIMPKSSLFVSESRRGSAFKSLVIQATPCVLPECNFVTVAVEISENELSVFVDSICIMQYIGPVSLGEFDVFYRSGFGCNAEWHFPNWQKKGAFLFKSSKNTSLRSHTIKGFESLPYFLPFYQHYGRHQLQYKDDMFIKCDDDIVFIDLSKLQDFIDFRWARREYFIVSANVVNNGVCAFFQQQTGAIPSRLLELEMPVGGINGTLWESAEKAEIIHRLFTSDPEEFRSLSQQSNEWNERISINFVSWLGNDFLHISEIMLDDEEYLSYQARWHSGKKNIIFGPLIVAHLTFYTQESGLDIQVILNLYSELARESGVLPSSKP